ncbi:hypothetical protein OU5_5027 [Pseudomonas mandelii JR-1]|uniref:Uncharacterized protein n=1 Tax=Pseudomonas mandelii JR-1 TaxID=1147786 RepID=A0A024EHM0_9PSED|nr:hypothetical protein OU5_5027 [Pseudomonas mandelii JR-1]
MLAEKNNDLPAAVSAFKAVQEEFHQESNRLKNSSLYVDFDGGFTSPQDVISKADYEKIRDQNAEFMGLNNLKVQMLSRWKNNLASAAGEVQQLYALLEEERHSENPLAEVLNALREKLKGRHTSWS